MDHNILILPHVSLSVHFLQSSLVLHKLVHSCFTHSVGCGLLVALVDDSQELLDVQVNCWIQRLQLVHKINIRVLINVYNP